MSRRVAWLLFPSLAALVLASSCAEKERPGYFQGQGGSKSDSPGAVAGSASYAGAASGPWGIEDPNCPSPTPIDPTELCGNEVIPVAVKRPNLYFLLDVSGSMNERIDGRLSKLAASKAALERVVTSQGHRLNYGLATFPSSGAECATGKEVFRTQAGDPLDCGEFVGGPTLRRFTKVLGDIRSAGGTPLSPTLDLLDARLRALAGPTSLILLTDGAPNCNPDARCDASDCSLSLAGVAVGNIRCSSGVNCCDPRLVQDLVSDPGSYCLDRDESVKLVEDLRKSDVTTFVVGVPGAEAARDLMNELAEAGGAAREGATKYFDVRDDVELDEALASIGALVAQPCALELENPPVNAVELNVYLDGVVLPSLSQNGWGYRDGKVTLLGESCARVQRGEVEEIRVVAGCDLVLH